MCFWTEMAAMRWLRVDSASDRRRGGCRRGPGDEPDRPGGCAAAAAGNQGQRRGDLPGASKAGIRIPTAATTCCSATTTATRSRRSTSRSARTTASSRAAPTMGQPTYFHVAARLGRVRDQGAEGLRQREALTWTIVANGKTASVPVGLIKDYQIEPFKDTAMGNTPPVLKFSPTGQDVPGPAARRRSAS